MTDRKLYDECEWHTGKTFRLDRIDNASTCEHCARVAKAVRLRLALFNKEETR